MTRRFIGVLLALITLLIILYGIIWYVAALNVHKQIYLTLNYATPNNKFSSQFGYLQYKIQGLFKPIFTLEFINPILQLTNAEGGKINFKTQTLNVKVHFFSNILHFTIPDKTLNIHHPDLALTCSGNSSILYTLPKSQNSVQYIKVNYTDSQIICNSSDNQYKLDNIFAFLLISEFPQQKKLYDLHFNIEQAEKETAVITAGVNTNIVNSDVTLELKDLNIQHLDSKLTAKGEGGLSFSYHSLLQSNIEMYLTNPTTFLEKFKGSPYYSSLDSLIQNHGKKLEDGTVALLIKTEGRTLYINEKEISDFATVNSPLSQLELSEFNKN